jgi:hypothetical protein
MRELYSGGEKLSSGFFEGVAVLEQYRRRVAEEMEFPQIQGDHR